MATLTAEERKETAAEKRRMREAGGQSEQSPGLAAGMALAEANGQYIDTGLSIIKKASTINTPSTLVFGNAGSGKSTLVRETILKSGQKPLWLPLNNDAALADPRAGEWDIAVPSDWDEFISGIYQPAMKGKLTGYTALVVDGGNVLTTYSVNKQAPGGQAGLQEWLIASNKLRDALVKLRDKFGALYVIVDTVPDKSGGRKIDLNPYTRNVLIPLFGAKWYTHIIKDRDANNKLTGTVSYTVQRNPALALDFTVGENFTLDSE